jgi:hypothetical protein
MITGLFGARSVTSNLRGGLEEASATQKVIARRVAGALNQSAAAGFGEELGARLENATETLEQDMAALADTQLRYEASARLLQMSYSDIRTAMRDRG